MAAPDDRVRPGLTFTKDDRLLRRSEFLAAQAKGRRLHSAHFTLILRDRGDGGSPRLGITTSRKVGNAVRRNRVRRLVREVFRTQREAFPAGHDCVVIVRENVPELSFDQVRDELLTALSRPRRASPSGAGRPGDPKMGPSPARPSAEQARRSQ